MTKKDTIRLSSFGEKFTRQSGIGQLMVDLGEACLLYTSDAADE